MPCPAGHSVGAVGARTLPMGRACRGIPTTGGYIGPACSGACAGRGTPVSRESACSGILFWRPRLALHMRSQGQHQPTNRRPLSPHNRQRGSRRPQHTTTASSSQEATSTEQETKCTGQHIPCPTKYLTVQLPNATTAAIASAKATGEHAHTMAAYHAGFRYVSTATESKTAPRVARQSAAGRRAWPLAGRRRET
jgi:hypothetical protein